ncbi:hypothetical protein [Metallosphaera hakonensis]|nr:hypothetical protein [Metallosphaera hakonensis]AWR98666.2 hypothetical protein DFR87_01940 [Metallosphaera hakonensis JCM 8857 = DSM 7519]
MSSIELNLMEVEIGYASVSTRRTMNYYFSERDYIPSPTMRGAFLYPLIKRGRKLEELEKYFFTPGYPLTGSGGNSPGLPVHPLAPAKDRKSGEYIEVKGVLSRWALEDFERLISEYSKLPTEEAMSPKPRVGNIVTLHESKSNLNRYNGISLDAFVQDSVAIGKRSNSSKAQMLFSYEVKKFDSVWLLTNLDEEVEEIHVGRGNTRGLGRGKVRRVRKVTLEIPGKDDVGYCLTPCVPTFLKKQYFVPQEIRGDTDIYMSWFTWGDPPRGGLRPSFKVLKEGTIVRMKEVGDLEQLWPAGLNFVVKIKDLGELSERVRP